MSTPPTTTDNVVEWLKYAALLIAGIVTSMIAILQFKKQQDDKRDLEEKARDDIRDKSDIKAAVALQKLNDSLMQERNMREESIQRLQIQIDELKKLVFDKEALISNLTEQLKQSRLRIQQLEGELRQMKQLSQSARTVKHDKSIIGDG